MTISRREFIRNAGIAALTASVILPSTNVFGKTATNGSFPVPPGTADNPLTYLKVQHFEVFVNDTFRFQKDGASGVKLQLVEANERSLPNNVKQGLIGDSYSLVFQNNSKSAIDHGLFTVTHEQLGRFDLLISPVGLHGNRYEAIVNRINV